jgi:DNA-binding CsgD family transcriptional regulator
MDGQTLSQIIPAATGADQQELLKLITKLEAFENMLVGFLHGHDNDTRFLYMCPSLEKIMGYRVSDFVGDTGFQFLYAVTPNEYRPHIFACSAYYAKEAKRPGFSTVAPQLMEINGGLFHKNGTQSKVRFLAVVLEYAANHDLLLTLGTWQNVDACNHDTLENIKVQVLAILTAFKQIYVRIHPQKFRQNGYIKEEALKVVFPLYKGPEVTRKEYEVLQLISKGYSSKKIAEELHISFHTAETHRKHLLGKFEASNTAELMTKASKVYWFE